MKEYHYIAQVLQDQTADNHPAKQKYFIQLRKVVLIYYMNTNFCTTASAIFMRETHYAYEGTRPWAS